MRDFIKINKMKVNTAMEATNQKFSIDLSVFDYDLHCKDLG